MSEPHEPTTPGPLRYLIWDFDGTLGYRRGGWRGAMVDAARLHRPDCAITAEEIRPHLAKGFRWHAPQKAYDAGIAADAWWDELVPLFRDAFAAACHLTDGQAELLAREVRRQYLRDDAWTLFDDSLKAIEQLTGVGYQHVLLTNHVPELPHLLERLRLDHCFERVFNSAHTGFEKPHPRAYENVVATIPRGSDITMIGDNPTADYSGARAAGIGAVLVRRQTPGIEPYFPQLDGLVHYLIGKTQPARGS